MIDDQPATGSPPDPARTSGTQRRVLFLQGPTSPFWRELALAFESAGHPTFKICVSLGDFLWWRRRGAVQYRGRFSRWGAFLEAFVRRNAITDILYYADRQPYHVVAQAVAARCGVAAISVENGYLRPDWITLELGGMGSYSQFPDDPALVSALAAGLPDPDLTVQYDHSFAVEMLNEILYHGFSVFYRPLYPFFRSGRYYNLFSEYLHGLVKLVAGRHGGRRAADAVEAITDRGRALFIVALQLQSDKQIQANSPFRHLREMIEMTIASFARSAPPDATLLFKQHPHDNGAERWDREIADAAVRHGVRDRVMLIDGGDLGVLLARARGCIVVNSTVGLYALRAGCPTMALGVAIYDMPGLTHQGSLDTFWTEPDPVDPALVAAFVRLLAASIQVKGSFYNVAGRTAAIAEIVRRVAHGLVNGGLPVPASPPRLARAHAMGVAIEPAAVTATGPAATAARAGSARRRS